MKRHNKTLKFKPELDKAYRKLWAIEPAGCSVCGNDAVNDLGIYQQDGSNREWQILCKVCHVPEKDRITREGAMS